MTVVAVPAAVGRSVVISGNMQCLIGGRVRQLKRIGNGTTDDLAIVYIKTSWFFVAGNRNDGTPLSAVVCRERARV
jgi:hypothetical protein